MIAAQGAIYASVGLAGSLGLLGVAFAAAFLVTIAAVLGIGLGSRPRAAELWIGVGTVAAYVMLVVRMGVAPLERTHLFEYGLVAVLVYEALTERRGAGCRVPAPAVLAVVITAGLGWIDEAIQAALPGRVYDLRDVGVNALAAVIATAARSALGWVRRPRSAEREAGGGGGTGPPE